QSALELKSSDAMPGSGRWQLPDGNADFTKGMGMLVQKANLGFGDRSWRYSMLVKDGVIDKLFIEPGISNDCESDPFEVSDAETLLNYIKGA
ncbi:redoxin family protein, partial [Patescibacteria group bacterium]|nr:redoxin family protein [Patescibacteria group bacterium]